VRIDLQNKKVTIIGAKKSGVAAASLLLSLNAIPFVSEIESGEKVEEFVNELKSLNVAYEIGGHTDRVYEADLFVISPGVPSNAPVIVEAKKRSIKVVSEIEFASWYCNSPIVAITGTNGKTTTTALLGAMFTDAGKENFVCGNIGNPFSTIVTKTNPNSIVILEVSSYQLDFCDTFHPQISIITNITPDHLERYDNKMENYAASKARISMNQTSTDYLIYNADDSWTTSIASHSKAKTYGFSLSKILNDGAFLENNFLTTNVSAKKSHVIDRKEILIPGMHNVENTMAATLSAQLFGIESNSIQHTLKTFKGVEHRIEFVREIDGVKYYNDSKATNVDAMIPALKAFELNGEQKIVLLLGGEDHGNDYSFVESLVKNNVRSVVAIGESAWKVFQYFKNIVETEIATSMPEAILNAKRKAQHGDIILLSPACKSFDWYKNFEERGKNFKHIVNSL